MKNIEDKRMVKLESLLTTTLFGAWSILLVHIQFTPSEKPKSFVILFYFIEIRP